MRKLAIIVLAIASLIEIAAIFFLGFMIEEGLYKDYSGTMLTFLILLALTIPFIFYLSYNTWKESNYQKHKFAINYATTGIIITLAIILLISILVSTIMPEIINIAYTILEVPFKILPWGLIISSILGIIGFFIDRKRNIH